MRECGCGLIRSLSRGPKENGNVVTLDNYSFLHHITVGDGLGAS